jgi:Tol biopolymer transport system component
MTVFNTDVWYWQDGKTDLQELRYDTTWYAIGWASDGEHLALVGEKLPFDRGVPVIARYSVKPRADQKLSIQELWWLWASNTTFGNGAQAKWSPDSKTILVYASGGRMLFRIDGGYKAGIFSGYTVPFQEPITSAEWSPDSRYIAFTSGSTLAFWQPSPLSS